MVRVRVTAVYAEYGTPGYEKVRIRNVWILEAIWLDCTGLSNLLMLFSAWTGSDAVCMVHRMQLLA